MSSPAALQQMAERHAGVIAELTGLLMDAARQCGADVAEAETPEAQKEAYDRLPALARAVRQCLALEGRMARDAMKDVQAAERALHDDQREKAEADEQAREARRRARKAPVWNRVLHTLEETLPEDDEDSTELGDRCEDLRTRLDDETFEAEFAHLSYEEVIRTLHRDLKLPEPEFTSQHTIRALIWAAQWEKAEAQPPAGLAPDPDPPPEPYFRYASG